jgi:hypothetical protein
MDRVDHPGKKIPEEKREYDPEVYRRLELVRKQFKKNTAEQKKLAAAQKRQAFFSRIAVRKISLGRLILYGLLAAVLVAVISVLIISFLNR